MLTYSAWIQARLRLQPGVSIDSRSVECPQCYHRTSAGNGLTCEQPQRRKQQVRTVPRLWSAYRILTAQWRENRDGCRQRPNVCAPPTAEATGPLEEDSATHTESWVHRDARTETAGERTPMVAAPDKQQLGRTRQPRLSVGWGFLEGREKAEQTVGTRTLTFRTGTAENWRGIRLVTRNVLKEFSCSQWKNNNMNTLLCASMLTMENSSLL